METMPKQNEWEEVRSYCCERLLVRPKTNIAAAVLSVIIFIAVVTLASFGSIQLVSWLGSRFQIQCILTHPVTADILSCVICFALCFLVTLKHMVIGVVKLYQHYAPDDVRRKCILKPTCSEYMILAVEKYGVFRGVKKGVHRLLFTCRGWDYRIDEP